MGTEMEAGVETSQVVVLRAVTAPAAQVWQQPRVADATEAERWSARLAAGDEAAWREVWAVAERAIRRVGVRGLERDTGLRVEDLTQRACLNLLGFLRRGGELHGSWRSFVTTTAIRTVTEEVRRKRPRLVAVEPTSAREPVSSQGHGGAENLTGAEVLEWTRTALGRLCRRRSFAGKVARRLLELDDDALLEAFESDPLGVMPGPPARAGVQRKRLFDFRVALRGAFKDIARERASQEKGRARS